MKKYLLILIFACVCKNNYSQICYRSMAKIDKKFKDTFTFHRQWAYTWDVFKEEDGSFSKASDDPITAEDTAHLYYTASCTTNVQGGYAIRYCYADNNVLTFSDGLPAYASVFRVHMASGTFYFEPKTVYPGHIRGEKITYRVDREKLVLNKSVFQPGELVMGHIDVEFTEISTVPGEPTKERKYFFKGYFRTPFPGKRPARLN